MNGFKEQLFQLFEVNELQADHILSLFKRDELAKGDLFLEIGKSADRLSFIASGYCRVVKWTEEKEVTQWIGSPGYFMTDLSSFFFNQPALGTIEALSPMVIWTLSKADYQSLEKQFPEWNLLEKRFLAKCFMQIESRVFDFIGLSAEERYLKYFHQHKALFNQVPLQYIASVLGMSPETLSRIRNKLAIS